MSRQTTRNATGSSSGRREMILDGNSDLQKGIQGTENVNIWINTRLLKSCLFLIKALAKHTAAKSKVTTLPYGVYNKCRCNKHI